MRLPSLRLRREVGQIRPDSSLGRWLQLLASDPDVKHIVEIGAWRGGGSTEILRRQIEHDQRTRLQSLEASKAMFDEAQRRHRDAPQVEVIWGSVCSIEDLDRRDLSDLEKQWLLADETNLLSCPNVTHRLFPEIDLLVLDGGEFSTYSEWRTLHSRVTKWVVLDDTLTRKSARIVAEVDEPESCFRLVWRSTERNGTAVLMRERVAKTHVNFQL